jgi:Ca2+-transporting ATPase
VTIHRIPEGKTIAYVKGAPNVVLEGSSSRFTVEGKRPLTSGDRSRFQAVNEKLASGSLRVLALAYRDLPDGYDESHIVRDLIFGGLIGMIDPLRDEATGDRDLPAGRHPDGNDHGGSARHGRRDRAAARARPRR